MLLEKQEQRQGRLSTRRLLLMAVGMPKAGTVHVGEMEPEENQSLFPGSDQKRRDMHLQCLCKS